MAKTIEDMGAMWPKNISTTLYGSDASAGSLAPKGFSGNGVASIICDSADDSVVLVLDPINVGITSIAFSLNYVGQANVAVTLTSADGITFTGTSATLVPVMVAASDANVSINVYFDSVDATADTGKFHTTELGGSKVPPVNEDGGAVRVGSPPTSPISYPDGLDGRDSADKSTPHYPT